MNKSIRIIINLHSGRGFKQEIEENLAAFTKQNEYACDIHYTVGPIHAHDLAYEAAQQNYFAVVCVGGDGTLNEAASALVNTSTRLGVVPIGSGNGFARHIGMSLKPTVATQQLMNSTTLPIDVCYVNKKPFFNVAGVGFDALVAHDFSTRNTRGFSSYLASVLKFWFSVGNTSYKLTLDGHKVKTKALMISFANGSQFGNNATIAPNASLNDGLMRVCILKKFPFYKGPLLTYKLFSGNIPSSKYLKIFTVKKVTVKRKRKKIHLDGEPFMLSKKLKIKVVPSSLNILAPQEYFEKHGTQHPLG